MNTSTMPSNVATPAASITDPFAAMTAGLTPKRAVSYIRVSTKEQAERGGEEGFSIPAQRDANKRKAQSMGAMVVKEFVERGVSGTTTNRPALQEMLRYLEEESGNIDYVIVHKIDRLARNRADDVEINQRFAEYGVRLVSTSENIDQTPGGLLLHGIMSSIAEFYSKNLSNEVKKGMAEKVRQGGTHGKAPLGYKNIRELKDGREHRTVEVDSQRAPIITWAFEQYATGEYSLRSLCQELVSRGLTMPQTARLPEKPIETRQVHQILTNDYYLGVVTFNGTKYPGNHEPLITSDLFDRVQQILRSKVNGERSIKHDHYLKSTLWCGQCGYRMMVQVAKTRSDMPYPYYSCTGRHSKRTNCDLRSITFDRAEELIQELYDRLAMKPTEASQLEKLLKQSLRDLTKDTSEKHEALTSQKLQIERKQRKLLEAHYNDAIPMDMLRREQKELDSQLLSVMRDLDALNTDLAKTDGLIDTAMELSVESAKAYKQSPDHIRRMFNRLFFKELRVVMDKDDNHQLQAILAAPFDDIYSPNWRHLPAGVLLGPTQVPANSDGDLLLMNFRSDVDVSGKTNEVQCPSLETGQAHDRADLQGSGHAPAVVVSSKSTVVPPVGLEPTLYRRFQAPPREQPIGAMWCQTCMFTYALPPP
ncbi:recombinase family protein [Schaalia sp. JY-X169]|uniref:recombinase family protein n=1 Tax=Schaalia sp. JY-X169 TaxID=2758572 RepID=UPI0015F6373B|nr:recombinase family protein [Schaalia sp. JY-X169]